MPIRLSEVHPSVVHFPIALLPVAMGADALGLVTGSRDLHAVGRIGIGLAAASAAVAGVFGLIAQEEVRIDDRTRPILQTHRTLNVAALGVVTALAVARASMKRPGVGYLLAGLAAIGTVSYSAYLGAKLVYSHGVAVEEAHGIAGADPDLVRSPRSTLALAARDLANGVVHAAKDMARGVLVPTLTNGVNGSGRH